MKHKNAHHGEKPDNAILPVEAARPSAISLDPSSDSKNEATSASRFMRDDHLTAQREQYLRLAADFDNFRKRTQRETAKQSVAEKNSFIHDLLPILDNLERAIVCDRANSDSQLHAGVEMTLRQLGQMFHRHGIEAMEEVGKPFDPRRHEAICARNDPNKPDHSVLEVTQRGYCYGDTVFRPARVIVNDWSHLDGATDAG